MSTCVRKTEYEPNVVISLSKRAEIRACNAIPKDRWARARETEPLRS